MLNSIKFYNLKRMKICFKKFGLFKIFLSKSAMLAGIKAAGTMPVQVINRHITYSTCLSCTLGKIDIIEV